MAPWGMNAGPTVTHHACEIPGIRHGFTDSTTPCPHGKQSFDSQERIRM